MECGVWSVECGVWSVECGAWSVEFVVWRDVLVITSLSSILFVMVTQTHINHLCVLSNLGHKFALLWVPLLCLVHRLADSFGHVFNIVYR